MANTTPAQRLLVEMFCRRLQARGVNLHQVTRDDGRARWVASMGTLTRLFDGIEALSCWVDLVAGRPLEDA